MDAADYKTAIAIAGVDKPRRKLKRSAKARKAKAMKGKIKVSAHGW